MYNVYIMLNQEVLITGVSSASYIAGIIAEQMAIRKAGANRANLAEYGGDDFATSESSVSEGMVGTVKKLGLAAVSFVAIGAGGAGALIVYGAMPGETHQEQFAPLITVADRTGSTRFRDGAEKPFKQINDIAGGVSGLVKDNEILLALSNKTQTVTVSELTSNDPQYNAFGPSSAMTVATSTALDKAKNRSADGSEKKGSNVLIVTNGNSIGYTNTIVSTAKSNDAAVFIVNTQGDKADPATIVNLQAISEKTGAQYWSGTSTEVTQIAKVVNNKFKTAETTTQKPLRGPAAILGGLLLVGVANNLKRTKDLTLQRGYKGEL